MQNVIFISDAQRLKRLLEVVESAGWSACVHDRAQDASRAIFVCDVPTGAVVMGGFSPEFEQSLEAETKRLSFSFDDYVDCLNKTMSELVAEPIPHNMQSAICIVALQYLFGTQTYQLAAQARLNGRSVYPVIIAFIDHSTKDRMLRPALLSSPAFPSPGQIDVFVNEVLLYDRERHPYRFQSAEVIPFRRR